MDEFAIYLPCDDKWYDWYEIEPTFHIDRAMEERSFISSYLSSFIHNAHDNRAVSAYALFFRERQPSAKKLFPNANFGDFSKMIAAEWQSMSSAQRTNYKKKSERLRRQQIRLAALAKIQRVVNYN
ncbi:unnamed protein product [Auanema sp. JU1783]|nr:unnamed protein product [Auanema sp. JU1783]